MEALNPKSCGGEEVVLATAVAGLIRACFSPSLIAPQHPELFLHGPASDASYTADRVPPSNTATDGLAAQFPSRRPRFLQPKFPLPGQTDHVGLGSKLLIGIV